MLRGVSFLFSGCLFLGCTMNTPHSTDGLFDTSSFFKSQSQLLQAGNYGLDKTIFFEEKKNSIYLDSLNWNLELASFSVIDLKKPAYRKRFAIDSVSTPKEKVVHYHRIDKETDIEDVWIHKNDSIVSKIKIVFAEQNQLYSSGRTLIFFTNHGFEISGQQSVKLSSPFFYKVTGVFRKPNVNR